MHAQQAGNLQGRMTEMGRAYEQAGYHGAVLLAGKEGILGQTAFGTADQETGRKNKLQTLFKTESTGKLFTATAVMQLVEQGKLDLQQTVAHYLPASGIKNAGKMTLHHLLTHQSGLTAPWEKEGFEFREYEKDEWWELITTNTTAFEEPGSGVYYSSSGYEVLAEIIETVSGKSFEEYCKDHLFAPAGMQNTFYRMDTLELAKTGAKPYRWTGMESYYAYPLRVFHAGGAGGWFSTVADFHAFGVALRDHRLVSRESLELMMQPHVPMGGGSYGYGIQMVTDKLLPGKTVYGHNGGGMGYGADLLLEPESGTIMVGMLNMYGNSTAVNTNFMKLALDMESATPKPDPGRLLFDRIEAGGLEDFAANYGQYCEAAGLDGPDPRVLIRLGDNYRLLERMADHKKYYELLAGILPEHPIVWLQLGDIALEEKNKDLARAHYEKAKTVAEAKDPYWLDAVKQKLGSL